MLKETLRLINSVHTNYLCPGGLMEAALTILGGVNGSSIDHSWWVNENGTYHSQGVNRSGT